MLRKLIAAVGLVLLLAGCGEHPVNPDVSGDGSVLRGDIVDIEVNGTRCIIYNSHNSAALDCDYP